MDIFQKICLENTCALWRVCVFINLLFYWLILLLNATYLFLFLFYLVHQCLLFILFLFINQKSLYFYDLSIKLFYLRKSSLLKVSLLTKIILLFLSWITLWRFFIFLIRYVLFRRLVTRLILLFLCLYRLL